jgi:hypothetical protein
MSAFPPLARVAVMREIRSRIKLRAAASKSIGIIVAPLPAKVSGETCRNLTESLTALSRVVVADSLHTLPADYRRFATIRGLCTAEATEAGAAAAFNWTPR